jgi:alpha-glucosidase
VDQNDPNTYKRENEFLFGDHILVSPVLRAKARSVSTYLPQGQWLDYWTGKTYNGGQRYSIRVKMNKIPLFVRAGAVIPNYPVMQYVDEVPVREITLRTYVGAADSQCYIDQGEGYGYEKRQYKLCKYSTEVGEDGSFKIKQRQSGKYKPACKSYRILLHGLQGSNYQVMIDGKTAPLEIVDDIGVLTSVPFKFKKIQVVTA